MKIKNPLSPKGTEEHITTVLYALAGQGGCDGTPYDEMQIAADYILELERKINKDDIMEKVKKIVDSIRTDEMEKLKTIVKNLLAADTVPSEEYTKKVLDILDSVNSKIEEGKSAIEKIKLIKFSDCNDRNCGECSVCLSRNQK